MKTVEMEVDPKDPSIFPFPKGTLTMRWSTRPPSPILTPPYCGGYGRGTAGNGLVHKPSPTPAESHPVRICSHCLRITPDTVLRFLA